MMGLIKISGLYFLVGWVLSIAVHLYEYFRQRKLASKVQPTMPEGWVVKPMRWSLERLVAMAILWPFTIYYFVAKYV